jgi:hypothetical protein
MVPVLMTVGAQYNEVGGVVRSAVGLFDNVVNLEALLSTDGAPMPRFYQQLVTHSLGDCQNRNLAAAV